MGARTFPVAGFLLAVASAACFALSGVFASALISAGWSPGAAAAARICVAAAVLAGPTIVMLRGRWRLVLRGWRHIVLFGLLGIVCCQLAFFLAVAYIAPSLAILIEFMGPVLLMLWFWARTRVAPSGLTLVGAVVAVLGLVTVSGVAFGGAIHPLGVLFGLLAAVGNAAYYAAGASADHGIPTIPFVGLGLAVAAVGILAAGAIGVLPFSATADPVLLAGARVPMWTAVAGVALVSTVLAYLCGVAASRRLGATVASFTGYAEPLFGIVWTIVLLAVFPTPSQWLGAALIIAGVVVVKLGEVVTPRRRVAAARSAAPSAGTRTRPARR